MKKNMFLCVDLETQMKGQDLQVMDSRKGTLYRNGEDRFTFTERGARPHEVHKEKHWVTIERTRNGKVSANDTHIKLELYIRHENYEDGRDLADQLAYQTEQMGETLCETNLEKLVESIRALKK